MLQNSTSQAVAIKIAVSAWKEIEVSQIVCKPKLSPEMTSGVACIRGSPSLHANEGHIRLASVAKSALFQL